MAGASRIHVSRISRGRGSRDTSQSALYLITVDPDRLMVLTGRPNTGWDCSHNVSLLPGLARGLQEEHSAQRGQSKRPLARRLPTLRLFHFEVGPHGLTGTVQPLPNSPLRRKAGDDQETSARLADAIEVKPLIATCVWHLDNELRHVRGRFRNAQARRVGHFDNKHSASAAQTELEHALAPFGVQHSIGRQFTDQKDSRRGQLGSNLPVLAHRFDIPPSTENSSPISSELASGRASGHAAPRAGRRNLGHERHSRPALVAHLTLERNSHELQLNVNAKLHFTS